MPQITYVHHKTNESEAEAQNTVREGLRLKSEELGLRTRVEGDALYSRKISFGNSVGFEYKTEGGELFITGWLPYRLSGVGAIPIPEPFVQPPIAEPVIEQPVIEQPKVEEPTVVFGTDLPSAACEDCTEVFYGKNVQGAKNRLRTHIRKVHS